MRVGVVTIALAVSIAVHAAPGTLSVTSDPAGATVYVDGRVAGTTPLTTDVAEGDHRVRLVKDGFLENARIVTVGGGRTASVQVKLTARAAGDAAATQQQGSGISSGPPPDYRKWPLTIGSFNTTTPQMPNVRPTMQHKLQGNMERIEAVMANP